MRAFSFSKLAYCGLNALHIVVSCAATPVCCYGQLKLTASTAESSVSLAEDRLPRYRYKALCARPRLDVHIVVYHFER